MTELAGLLVVTIGIEVSLHRASRCRRRKVFSSTSVRSGDACSTLLRSKPHLTAMLPEQ